MILFRWKTWAKAPPTACSGCGLAQALLLDQIGEQESEVDRLLGVEPRIAHRVIAGR